MKNNFLYTIIICGVIVFCSNFIQGAAQATRVPRKPYARLVTIRPVSPVHTSLPTTTALWSPTTPPGEVFIEAPLKKEKATLAYMLYCAYPTSYTYCRHWMKQANKYITHPNIVSALQGKYGEEARRELHIALNHACNVACDYIMRPDEQLNLVHKSLHMEVLNNIRDLYDLAFAKK